MTTHIRFAKRIVPVQYEYEEMEVTFSVDVTDDLSNKTKQMKDFVYNTLLNINTIKADGTNVTATTTPEKSNGNKESSKSGSKEVCSKSKEEVISSPSKEGEVISPSKDEVKSEKKEKKTKPANSDIPYDSAKQEHKSTLTNHLTKITGGKKWAEDKEKSKAIAQKLHNLPFMSKEGAILDTFTDLLKKEFAFAMVDSDETI